MADLVHNTNVIGQGIKRLLFTFQDKPRIIALLTSYLRQVQELQDAVFAVWLDRQLSGGDLTTDLLNKIGKLVGQQREGFDNATYTLLITARIAANRSDGFRETLIHITSLLIPNTVIVFYQFNPQAEIIVPQGPVGFDPYLIARQFLLPAAAGGEWLALRWTTAPFSATLIWGWSSGGTTPTVAQSPGWSGGMGVVGGQFGGLIAI
jgi:hypothetical protein